MASGIPMRKFFPCLLLCLLSVPTFLTADTVVEEIIARVNNQIITRTEYQRSREQLKQEAQQQDPANANKTYSEREKDVLRDLIDQQLLLEKGKDLSITGDTELIKRLDQMRKDMKLESLEELEKKATEQGISWEDFKQNKRNQIITQKVIGEEVGRHLAMTEEEAQKFYNEHKSELEQPEAVHLSEILVAPKIPADATPKTTGTDGSPSEPAISADQKAANEAAKQATEAAALSAAAAKAHDLPDQIHKGATSEEIVKKHSNGPAP